LKAVEVTLAAPVEVVAGAEVEIVWTGPANDGDYLTIVPQSMREDGYAAYKYTNLGSPVRVVAPIEPGACEIRYVSGKGRKVFARRALTVRAAEVTLRAPAKAVLGTQVSVEWTGPNNRGDHLTIVPKGTPEGRTERTAMTSRGSPALVGTPKTPGPCELRYVSGQGGRTLARAEIEITPAGTSP
jgi:Ca-activated chloride channel family protein